MPTFDPGQTVETREPTILVEIDPDRPLRPGAHRFSLVVVDDSNNVSRPAIVSVTVLDTEAPTAIIDAPESVAFGAEFTLSGERSVDVGGGTIAAYRWTLLQ